MFRNVKLVLGVVASVALVVGASPFVETAGAVHIVCGAEIRQSVTLDSNVGPCPGNGLIVRAGGIVINLNGHSISGLNGPEATAGIVLYGVKRVTVTGGTVTGFDAGVVIGGGGQNKVEKLVVRDNFGNSVVDLPDVPPRDTPDPTQLVSPCDLGDGIVTFDSKNNVISSNTVRANGPLSGIALVGSSAGNTVKGNTVTDNNSENPVCGPPQNIGVRVEGPGANGNTVEANVVDRSGLNGIAVHPSDPGSPANANNLIAGNTVRQNGTNADGGSGIVLMVIGPANVVVAPSSNTVRRNTATANTLDGIRIDGGSTGNTVTQNTATTNTRFDGADRNDTCDNNAWRRNRFGTVNQSCVA